MLVIAAHWGSRRAEVERALREGKLVLLRINVGFKLCSKCDAWKSRDDFYKSRSSRDGFSYECKACRCERTKDWNRRNAEQHRESAKRWARENPERRKRYMKTYMAARYENERAEILKRNSEWAKKNPAKQQARTKRWLLANPGKANQYQRKWHEKNPTYRKLYGPIAYAARKSRMRGVVSVEAVQARIAFYGYRCAYCGGPFEHVDHVIPLSRGGPNTAANLRPACARCNLSKGSKKLSEWKRPASCGY